ncbi:dockerin type I domain-containing protein [Ruminococcus albus]|uniref:Alpha-tubulin suppressor n=1 Tax=Ruminococcus albus TaxID=1264 RepID=A0A1I1RLL4_RUMAL|nr:dockerin type I domain-containing protein [Ruminococcus albus]SFD32563.1 Alpha-tubulin suppressor [Ruminococcus albus]
MLLKRILSATTSLTMMFAMVNIVPATAQQVSSPQVSSTQISSDELNIDGTNSFGRMVASVLDEKKDEQNEGNGCNIFSVEINGNIATVDYQTKEDCTLIVGIYSEDGKEMIATGTTEVKEDSELAEITLDTETMPEYFFIKAFLVDSTVFSPLSTVYESPMYTKEMQEFLTKTTDDFEADRVLNLDNDKRTNFAVYGEEVILLDENDGVLTEDGTTYVITNASERVKGLKSGDIFAYGDVENVIIVTVENISTDGDTVTITENPYVEMKDVFQYVKIDINRDDYDTDINDIAITDDIVSDGKETSANTINSVSDYRTLNKSNNSGKNNDKKEWNKFLDLKWGEKYNGRDKEDNLLSSVTKGGNGSLDGAMKLKLEPSAKVYLTWEYRYLELKVDFNIGIDVKLELDGYIAFPLCEWKCNALGIVEISFVPSIKLNGKFETEFTWSVHGTWGFKISNQGNTDLTKLEEDPVELKVEGKVFFGISFEPKLKVLHEKIASAEASAEVGLEIECKKNGKPSDVKKYSNITHDECFKQVCLDDKVDSVHLCDNCLSINVAVKINIKASVKFLFGWVDLEGKFKAEWPLWSGHWSLTHNHFGSDGCPHEKFKVTVHVQEFEDIFNTKGKDLQNADVDINGKSYSTGTNGYFRLMLSSGRYETKALCGNLIGGRDIRIESAPADIVIPVIDPANANDVISKLFSISGLMQSIFSGNVVDNSDDIEGKKVVQVAFGTDHSACITEDGCLYTLGNNESGQLGDGTTENKYKPVKIMNNVSQVSLGTNYSACITKEGNLYTWGWNYHGQLGDGTDENRITPVKIMDNVVQVCLGNQYSACITKYGSLYMWGMNYYGQLGDGSIEDKFSPIKIMDNAKKVIIAPGHFCGCTTACLSTDDSLYIWGANYSGQVGDGTTEHKNKPIKIMNNVSQISLGTSHSACISKDGNLYTWGNNMYGEIGDGTYDSKLVPKKIMDNVVQVCLGESQSACITKDGALYTWGYNYDGILGYGSKQENEDKNIPVKVMDNVEKIILHVRHSACITKDRTLYEWGHGDYSPVKIMDNIKDVNIGTSVFESPISACITNEGSLFTWGNNEYGQLGDGTTEYKLVPTKIAGPTDDIQTTHKALNAAPAQPETPETEPLFTGLKANETYNLYAFKDLANGMTNENLLYITQQTADENGSIDFKYKLKTNNAGTWLAVPMGRKDISSAEVKIEDLKYTGESQIVTPTVKLNDVTLSEGIDYYLEGDYSVTEPGEYTVTIVGIGLYTGRINVGFKVISNLRIGDVNGDGSINITDITKTAAHVKGKKLLSKEQQKRADINGDSKITITDITKIAAHVKGKRLLP